MHRIGVVDTMFARYDMGAEAIEELAQCPGYGRRFEIVRRTVPGFKDLAVAGQATHRGGELPDRGRLGHAGQGAPIDKTCAHEASTGIMTAQLMTNTPILEVFVHEDEEDDPDAPGRGVSGPGPQARPQRLLDALRARAAGGAGGQGRPTGLRRRRSIGAVRPLTGAARHVPRAIHPRHTSA